MLGLWRIKVAVRNAITRHRRSAFVRRLRNVSSFVEMAWHNQDFDSKTNGEKALLERMRPANFKVVFDAGANVGSWARHALDAWVDCTVHAFEIAPPTIAKLKERAASWPDARRACLHPSGLSDVSGTVRMYFYPEDHNLTSDVRRHEKFKAEEFDGSVVTLDEFCAEHGIHHVDFLKVDVEGTELRVLKGARRLIESGAIDCIQFEYGAFARDARVILKDYFSLLEPTYVIGKIFPTYVDFGEYDWSIESFLFGNFLCVSRAHPELQQLAQGAWGQRHPG